MTVELSRSEERRRRSERSSKSASRCSRAADEAHRKNRDRARVAGAGFGAGIARRFALEGARVRASTSMRTPPAPLRARWKAKRVCDRCDIADGASYEAMVAQVSAQAAASTSSSTRGADAEAARIAKTPEADVDRLLAVNVKSFYYMAVHALPVLRKRGGGVVINIASVTAIRPRPACAGYQETRPPSSRSRRRWPRSSLPIASA